MDVTIASTTINQEVWARYCRQSTREQEYSIPKQNEVLDHCFPDISYNSKDYFADVANCCCMILNSSSVIIGVWPPSTIPKRLVRIFPQ